MGNTLSRQTSHRPLSAPGSEGPAAPRDRRLEQEWKLLGQLAQTNPGVLEVLRRRSLADSDIFEAMIHQTCGILSLACGKPVLARSHRVAFRFPRFFPSVPVEAVLAKPVFHPNVDPRNGFVCLWTRTSAGDTVMEAARRLQQMIAWKLVNFEATHVMQPEAVDWAHRMSFPASLVLDFTPLVEVESFRREKSFTARPDAPFRRRLEPLPG
jgi:ubiquitin-protein ligase